MSKKSTLMEEVRRKLRLLHYSIHTERSYCDWIRRYVKYHGMRSRQDLAGGEAKIEAFLSHLAVDQNVVRRAVKIWHESRGIKISGSIALWC
jgi:hypothetical protein